jgi:hypothetical protein
MAEFVIPEGYGLPLVDLDTDLLPAPTMDAITETVIPAVVASPELSATIEAIVTPAVEEAAPKGIASANAHKLDSGNRVSTGQYPYRPVGQYDPATIMWFFRDGAAIFQTDNYGASFSNGRTLPSGTDASVVATVCRLGSYDYMLAAVAGIYSVYRAPSVTMNQDWSGWSAALVTLRLWRPYGRTHDQGFHERHDLDDTVRPRRGSAAHSPCQLGPVQPRAPVGDGGRRSAKDRAPLDQLRHHVVGRGG